MDDLEQHDQEMYIVRSCAWMDERWVSRDDIVRILTLHSADARRHGHHRVADRLLGIVHDFEQLGGGR